MKLLGRYLAGRRRTVGAFALFGLLFVLTFYFYRLPMKAILYPLALCAMLGLSFLLADFLRVRRLHRLLSALKEQADWPEEMLPPPSTVLEEDYQAMASFLRQTLSAREAAAGRRYQDMIDYYTVWVHQIKTPISSMRLTLQEEDSPLSRKLTLDLFHIEQYVEMVLAYLRLDSASSDYVFRECNLDGLIRRTARKFAGEFISRRIRFVYESVQASVLTDEKWLGFVLEQLLSNALKYTRQGTVTVSMPGPGLLCVADTGVGIAPEDLPRIFERGYTGCNGREEGHASGLGLYLCRRVCENLGIRMSVTSRPDEGTAFTLDLNRYDLKIQ